MNMLRKQGKGKDGTPKWRTMNGMIIDQGS